MAARQTSSLCSKTVYYKGQRECSGSGNRESAPTFACVGFYCQLVHYVPKRRVFFYPNKRAVTAAYPESGAETNCSGLCSKQVYIAIIFGTVILMV